MLTFFFFSLLEKASVTLASGFQRNNGPVISGSRALLSQQGYSWLPDP
jgi:hypothetical protein